MSDELTIPSYGYRPPQRARQGMDPGLKRLLVITGGIVGVLVVGVGGYSLIGKRGGDVPVIQADDRPVRFKPENPGGLQVAGVGQELYGDGNDSAARLAPAPEAPNPAALKAAQPQPPHAQAQPQPQTPPASGPQPLVAAKPNKPEPATSLPSTPKASATTSTTAPATKPAPAQTAAAAPASNHAQASAAAAPAEKKPAVRIAVQVGALATEDAARNQWKTLVKQMPELFGSRQPIYARTERDGRTLWRVRTGGFGDAQEARQFCEKVRGRGGNCLVAEF